MSQTPTRATVDLVSAHGQAYEQERRRLTRRRARTACLLATGVVPFYIVTDALLYPEFFSALFAFRVLSVLLSVSGFILARGPLGQRFPYFLCDLLCFGLAMANSGIPVLLLGYAVPYYVGFIVVVFGIALLLPLRPVHAAVLAVGLLMLYAAASLVHGPITNWPAFACNASFIGTTIGIALVSMGAGEELRRREFQGRLALQQAYDNKSQLAGALADKTTKLESLNQEMEDLLYVASHDLRAPLINVQGFSRELQLGLDAVRNGNGKSPETSAALTDIDESLQFILTAVARMDSLITSLLNVSRIATRTNPTEQVDLQRVTQKVAESFHYQLTDKAITLELEPLPVVTGDAVQLGRLFSNLIDNAIKYMGSTPDRRIHIGACSVEGERRFFVQDNGVGIRGEDHEQIFRLFRRLSNGDCPGEGIGLTIVRKIVEKHGGRVWVDSAPGAGTAFWFTLHSAAPALALEVDNGRGTQAGDHSLG